MTCVEHVHGAGAQLKHFKDGPVDQILRIQRCMLIMFTPLKIKNSVGV